ncbi:hypothetical protein BVRB_2g033320 [Beta vulgaris subsp. vulgaris]|uniref:Uncharacterized protein n=1 Tax=Beta vulgaris subsp. vulgaris TaxID=3555 RepID=A0A0J8FQD7_BETVV|nr:hypothetical protein BVRB_2g033320 [Beta vulgaris subsp. vulgaris]
MRHEFSMIKVNVPTYSDLSRFKREERIVVILFST